MYARLYTAPWNRTGRDRTVMSMPAIRDALASYATSDARTDFRYIKKGSIKLPGVASSQDYRANYLIYSNDDVHFFGAWIDSIEWSSAGSFAVNFTDDYFQSFIDEATVAGYRVRRRVTNWSNPGNDLIDGDMIVKGWKVIDSWQLAYGSDTSILVYLVNSDPSFSFAFSKLRGSAFIAVIEDATDLADFINLINQTTFSFDNIISAYTIPKSMYTSGMITTGTYYYSLLSSVTLKTFRNSSDPLTTTWTPSVSDYKPFLNNHDMQVRIMLGGSSVMYKIDDFSPSSTTSETPDPLFFIQIGFSPSPYITFTPRSRVKTGATFGTTPSFGFAKFPQTPVSASAFANWLQSKAVPAAIGILGGALTGGAGAAIGGVIGGGLGLVANAATAHVTPDYMSGDSDAIFAAGRPGVGIDFLVPANHADGAKFYDQFGFPCQKRETITFPAASGSETFDFIQSTDNVITGSMPQAAKDEIDAALKAGVRVWNTINIGGYS